MVDFPFSVWYIYIVRYFVSPTNRNSSSSLVNKEYIKE